MSKNFELMQQAGLDQPITTIRMPESPSARIDENDETDTAKRQRDRALRNRI